MSGCRSEAGRLFQILGPAIEKLLSPSRMFVLGTVRTLAWAGRSWGRPASAISWQSSTRYDVNFKQFKLILLSQLGPKWAAAGCGYICFPNKVIDWWIKNLSNRDLQVRTDSKSTTWSGRLLTNINCIGSKWVVSHTIMETLISSDKGSVIKLQNWGGSTVIFVLYTHNIVNFTTQQSSTSRLLNHNS